MTTNGVNVLIISQNFVVTFCLQTVYRLSTDCLQVKCTPRIFRYIAIVASRHGTTPINTTGMTFGACPFFDWFSPNVSHWANNTHHRHTAGFNYGVPWHAATRTYVFCRSAARPPMIDCRKTEKNLYYKMRFL